MFKVERNSTAQPRTLRSRLGLVLLVLVAGAGALLFRLPKLDNRPMHGDEANQAFKAGLLIEKGDYRYDPVEHHGPTLYYLTLPVAWLTSAGTFADTTEWTYRSVPVLFGACTICLVLLAYDGLGFGAILFACVFLAISPPLVFYSRYYIQETLLVFFSFAAIVSGWRYFRTRKAAWAVLTGVMLGLTHATKETSILSFAAMGGALVFTIGWSWLRDGRGQNGSLNKEMNSAGRCRSRFALHMLFLLLAAVLVSATLYSSFFTNLEGPGDSFRTYETYVARAQNEHGEGIHDKPWDYFLQLLVYFRPPRIAPWSNRVHAFLLAPSALSFSKNLVNGVVMAAFCVPHAAPWKGGIVDTLVGPSVAPLSQGLVVSLVMSAGLAFAGAISAFARRWNNPPRAANEPMALRVRPHRSLTTALYGEACTDIRFVRFLAVYTVLITAMYSTIPYKTPWCIINFVQPMMILAGVGAACLIGWARFRPAQIAAALLIVAGTAHLGVLSYRASYVCFVQNRENPYVYAHPSAVVGRLPQRAEDLAKVSPEGHHMLIKVIASGGDYWPLPWYLRAFDRVGYWNNVPDNPDASMIIASPALEQALAMKLRDTYIEEYYELRPGGVLLKVYIEKGLWDRFLASRP